MMLNKLLPPKNNQAEKLYSDDVFATWLYAGNNSAQPVPNGLDLQGRGGLVWLKRRDVAGNNLLMDTNRGNNFFLASQTSAAQGSGVSSYFDFGNNGFNITAGGSILNETGSSMASWCFRKAQKFFDIRTVTKSAGSDAVINFNSMGAPLGMVIVKRTDGSGIWWTWHRSLTPGRVFALEQTAMESAVSNLTVANNTVTLVNGIMSDGNYVLYAWAHDTDTNNGIVQCGSFTTDASGNATVNLGWEPQFLLIKKIDGASHWLMSDSIRGMPVNGADPLLKPNSSDAELSIGANIVDLTSTGFQVASGLNGTAVGSFAYLAIRRPNKPPTSGSQVFSAKLYTSINGSLPSITHDVIWDSEWNSSTSPASVYNFFVQDRLRAGNFSNSLLTAYVDSEIGSTPPYWSSDGMFRWYAPSIADEWWASGASETRSHISYAFRRSPEVFDQVVFSGTGAAQTVTHQLRVVPELVITKPRTGGLANWGVYHSAIGYSRFLQMNNDSIGTAGTWVSSCTSTTFGFISNTLSVVAYLFASKAGISKVGAYTGNGSTQTINCNFSTGARFILIKRTDAVGHWYVWDVVRGIVEGNDPHLSLNANTAEVTTNDSIDPHTSGFIVNQVTETNINVTSGQYIFLALA